MRYLKILVIAIIMLSSFGSAMAQVTVRARIGHQHRHWHHRHWHHLHHRKY